MKNTWILGISIIFAFTVLMSALSGLAVPEAKMVRVFLIIMVESLIYFGVLIGIRIGEEK